MEEIFDREHDDDSAYHSPHIVPHNNDFDDHAVKFCKHCGGEISLDGVVCPSCGRWWVNSES